MNPAQLLAGFAAGIAFAGVLFLLAIYGEDES